MALRNQEQINRDLKEHDTHASQFQSKLLKYVLPLLKASSDEMCKYHESWESYDWIYRGYRVLDREDKEAAAKDEPTKLIVPLTFAQVQTAISFLVSTFLQKKFFYELRGMGPEDDALVFALETDMGYQLMRQGWTLKLYYMLLDAFKYGFGVVKCDWEEKHCWLRTQRREPVYDIFQSFSRMLGRQTNGDTKYKVTEEVAQVLEYQGSRLRVISPFSFYPDPNLPISKFQEGAFVCHEEERALAEVRRMEGEEYFGTDKIEKSLPTDVYKSRSRRAGRNFNERDLNSAELVGLTDNKLTSAIIFTEVEFRMSGKELNEKFGLQLEPKDYQQKWVATMGNDNKVISFKPTGYLHQNFNYALVEYSPDSNAYYNPGLAETVQELQGLVTFFLNSHVVNVRKIVSNRFVGDPTYINSDDVLNNKLFIRTKSQVPGDISRVFKQLEVSDVTKNHVNDVQVINQIMQLVTGINENALGQYSQGRRSATEARNVNAGAAARLKMHATLMWNQGLEPLGRMILANTRQGRTKEVYDAIVGAREVDAPFEQVILADPNKIAGGYDFMPFDASLPSDRGQQASWLIELFTQMISNEQAMLILQKDPTKMLKYIAELLDIKNLDQFNLTPDQPLQMPQPQVVPDEQAAAARAAGAAPVDIGGDQLRAALG